MEGTSNTNSIFSDSVNQSFQDNSIHRRNAISTLTSGPQT